MLYGAAEFSRDVDLAILAEPDNLVRLRTALDELKAESIAVPPFDRAYLDMGLAVHFRCRHPEAGNVRLDLMSKLRGVDPFATLWNRRTTVEFDADVVDLLSLPDLVRAKKTQRDKDWPMIRRLLETHFFQYQAQPTPEQVDFWIQELRTPGLLIEVAARFPREAAQLVRERPLLELALKAKEPALCDALADEEKREREADRVYWLPLKKELQRLRAAARARP